MILERTEVVRWHQVGKEKQMEIFKVFLDFEKAFDSIEWNFIHICLETFNFGLDLRQWI